MNGRRVSSIHEKIGDQTQSVILPKMIQQLWKSAGSPLLSCIIVPRGPGSFTALRVTLATAQGFALAFPAATVFAPTSFDLLFYGVCLRDGPVLALIESGRGDYFGQLSSDRAPLILTDGDIEKMVTADPSLRLTSDVPLDFPFILPDRIITTCTNLAVDLLYLYREFGVTNDPDYHDLKPYYGRMPVYVQSKKT
ncbi:MAG: tRNA threonylcarbamoyladenosine biosynthesis protein TsaB [Alphaproteobacteria bacterium]|nr:tRNA threonylcarbamoyladenosine biosynthesis protein TsaB [Alphaproteobacteria bacterium]